MTEPRKNGLPTEGFTLVEVLVALAIVKMAHFQVAAFKIAEGGYLAGQVGVIFDVEEEFFHFVGDLTTEGTEEAQRAQSGKIINLCVLCVFFSVLSVVKNRVLV